jgi:hypothetical protein
MGRGDKDREEYEKRAANLREEVNRKGIMQVLRDRRREESERMLKEQTKKGY